MTEEIYQTLLKIHGFLADGRIFLAREQLESLLNVEGDTYAPTDSKSN